MTHISTYTKEALDIFLWGAFYGLVVWLVIKPRPWHWITAVALVCGYLLFPSGTVFESTAVVVAIVGLTSPFLPRVSVERGDVLAAVGAGVFFAVSGLLARLLINNLSFSDALLLVRGVGPFFGFLHFLGYWVLAWSAGASIGVLLRDWFFGSRRRVPQ